MNLPDTNVWLALRLVAHTFHEPAREWFGRQPGHASALFCRATQQSLLRLLSTEGMMRLYGLPALPNDQAWHIYQSFRADARVGFAAEPADLEAQWKTFAARDTASPKLWMDTYLAAFAMTAGLTLVTTDKAFRHFKGLGMTVLAER